MSLVLYVDQTCLACFCKSLTDDDFKRGKGFYADVLQNYTWFNFLSLDE